MRKGNRQHGCRLLAGSLIAAAALAMAAGASGATVKAVTLTTSEKAFLKQYEKLIPALDKASGAVVTAVNNSANYNDATIASVFAAAAKQWESATKPLAKLKAPAPLAGLFGKVTVKTPAIEADLLAVAQAGSISDATAGKAAGNQLLKDFNALAAAVVGLGKKLGLH